MEWDSGPAGLLLPDGTSLTIADLGNPRLATHLSSGRVYAMYGCFTGETVRVKGGRWHVIDQGPSVVEAQIPVVVSGELPSETCSLIRARYMGVGGEWHRFAIMGQLPSTLLKLPDFADQ